MVESSYYYVGKAVYLSYDPKIWMHNILIKYTLQYVPESKPLKRWISREGSFPPSLKTQMGIYSYKKSCVPVTPVLVGTEAGGWLRIAGRQSYSSFKGRLCPKRIQQKTSSFSRSRAHMHFTNMCICYMHTDRWAHTQKHQKA